MHHRQEALAPSIQTQQLTEALASRVLKLREVEARVGLGRSSVYRLAALGLFPKQVKIGPRSSGWLEREVDQWLNERAAERSAG